MILMQSSINRKTIFRNNSWLILKIYSSSAGIVFLLKEEYSDVKTKMEGMLLDHYGFVSVIPPLLAIVLAIITKRVILSLFIGVLVGLFLFTGSIGGTLVELTEVLVGNLTDDWQGRVLLFTVLLGGLLGIMYSSGGSKAFGKKAAESITTREKAQLATWFLGVLIFFDDYFNALTVGAVMRNITDHFKVSREKLAYIIDSTAAPICIIIPISTWIAYAMSLYVAEFQRLDIEVNAFELFLEAIPYNFYALLAIIMVVVLSITKLEFGPMARAEERAIQKGQLFDEATKDEIPGQDITNLTISDRGQVSDLILPVLTLMAATIIGILYTGGFFAGEGFRDAIGDADAATALIYGTLLANLLGIIWYSLRKVMSLKNCMESFTQGMKAMIPALSILLLAWSIGDVAGTLGTGAYVAELVTEALPNWLIPMVIFITSAFMAFSTGTSWGTFAIMLPIGVPVAVTAGLNPAMCIAAVLGGAIFGDHSSPISDTTVLSSTGASCNHIHHVNTQLPYAILAAIISAIGYLLAAVINMSLIPLIFVIALLILALYVLHSRGERIDEDVAL